MYNAMIKGLKIIARAARFRCWATESATNFKAEILSSWEVRIVVVSSGTPSSGFGGGRSSWSSVEDMVARRLEERSGGSVCEDEG